MQHDHPPAMQQLAEATERSLAAATHLTRADDGPVEALRVLARQIDAGTRDNVTIPTYLKFCESLGLTPAGRLKLDPKKETPGGKLGELRSVHGGRKKAPA